MIVKNRDELSTTGPRRDAIRLVEAGIQQVLPPALMRSALAYDRSKKVLTVLGTPFPLSAGRVFVIGGGKASGGMAEELERILGSDTVTAGVVNCVSNRYPTRKIEIVAAGHPVPDSRGAAGTRRMLSLKEAYCMNAQDLVLCLISGGGSALMPCPADGISLEDKQKTTGLLLRSGASIQEINVVRKHLSKTKGGRLGRHFAPAKVVSLIISDVVGNDLASIASGPTAPDSSTFQEAHSLLERYELTDETPDSVLTLLQRGRAGAVEETPRSLDNCHNFIVGDNMLALEAMSVAARDMGLRPHIVTSEQRGDPSEAARLRAREIMEGKYSGYDALIIGGETSPRLPADHGTGGRNQHYAAATLAAMGEYAGNWVLASVCTDGSDFVPNVAGAIVDNRLREVATREKVDIEAYIRDYDSHTLLERLGRALVVTGNTGTNVSDIMVYVLR
ncbi:MAG: DUF4147 domain-containing protein [Candidatus Eisenbacteria bacterium]|nr:DUF4147 domain-containing protein [Candidatus Eisenbacteria bacterium]